MIAERRARRVSILQVRPRKPGRGCTAQKPLTGLALSMGTTTPMRFRFEPS
jgi:hypothetical protein